MSTAVLGTFDAERWWRPPDLAALPGVATTAVPTSMDELLAVCCSDGDLLVTRGPVAPVVRDGLAACGIVFDSHCPQRTGEGSLEDLVARSAPSVQRLRACTGLLPYAVLPDTVTLARRTGQEHRLPAAADVAAVNSKSWSNDLVQALGLPGAGRVVRSTDELRGAVADIGDTAVVKDPFGVSGRAMLEVGSPGVLRAITRTLQQQVGRGYRIELLVQPKFAGHTDFSGHLRIAPDGEWQLTGVQVMHNRGFRHLGSGPAAPDLLGVLDDVGYPDVLAAVAEALTGAGYWGPACVDSMLLADGTVVPVLEVNARVSLGLLSLLLDGRVQARGLRCHLWQADLRMAPGQGIDDVCRALRRAGVLYSEPERPGVTVLSGSGLAAPGGRVYCASLCAPEQAEGLRAAALTALAAEGIPERGAARAA